VKGGRSLVSRLSLLQQMVTVAVIVAFAVSSLWITRRTLQREERALLAEAATRIAGNVDRELGEEGNLARAAVAVVEEEPPGPMRIDIQDTAGRLLASSSRVASGPAADGREGDDDPEEITRVSVTSPGGVRITVSSSNRLREASMAALGRSLLLAAVPLLMVALFVGRWITRRALRPLAEMERRARDAAAKQGTRSIGPASGLAEIDELRDSFDRLLERLDDLLQSERRFTADASHELRTPLTVLSGELETVLARGNLPAEARPGLVRAAQQVQTMRDLVEALLLLRRGNPDPAEAGSRELVNLADLAREITREAGLREPERANDLELEAPDEVLVTGHSTLLASAVRNIVDNALKFTRPGQPVRVTVAGPDTGASAGAGAGSSADSAARPGAGADRASVQVDDAGPGVPPAERERVFDPFYRGAEARAERRGLGLGLPILRQVARAHGGEVTITESALGGARVTLLLPPLLR
jgi:signal transduction histidine kinase